MSVPAHDQRDFDFAVKYGLDIVVVICPPDKTMRRQRGPRRIRAKACWSIPGILTACPT
jgi:leucyl-tRNA synthetase